jgi:phage/conjugal plasmid C-4 type zinc finger TraR family protein
LTDIFDRASELELRQREDAIARQRASVAPVTDGKADCVDCGVDIPAKRREAVPGCTRCIECERSAEVRRKVMKR